MTREELRKYVHQIIAYLKADFHSYEEAREKSVKIGAGPYLLTASSGIDFLGSLAIPKEELPEYAKQSKGLERKSTTGSKWYIRTYLGVVRSVYSSASVDDLIYKTLRCGQVHEGIVKRGVLIGTEMPNNYHLSILDVRESSDDDQTIRLICVNTRILAQDFISSTDHFVKDMVGQDPFASEMASRLSDHLSAIPDPSQGLALAKHEVDDDAFSAIYEFSSGSPDNPSGSYSLKPAFWEEA